MVRGSLSIGFVQGEDEDVEVGEWALRCEASNGVMVWTCVVLDGVIAALWNVGQ